MTPTRFAGRVAEKATVLRWLDDAAEGRCRMAFVAGEPGIGKTRLLQEASAEAHRLGFGVAWGGCWEGPGAPPFWPWIQVLKDLREGAAVSTDPALAWLTTAAGEPQPESADVQSRFRQFDAFASLLREMSGQRPLLIVLDDIHSADPGSVALIEFVSRDLVRGRANLLIVATYRDTESRADSPAGRIVSSGAASVMHLSGLSPEETAEFVSVNAALAIEALGVAALHDRTAGNPFLLGESIVSVDAAQTEGIGTSAAYALTERLSRLPTPVRETLEVAAVFGRDFNALRVARVQARLKPRESADAAETAAADATAVIQHLDEAEQARLTMPGAAPGDYRFVHALTREALYEGIPRERRMRLHEAAGAVTVSDGGDLRVETLPMAAHHYLQAAPLGNYERAAQAATDAAIDALRRLAYEQAAALFDEAARAAERAQPVSMATVANALLGRADCLRRTGEREAAEAICLELTERAQRRIAAGHADGAELLAEAALMWRLIRRGQDAIEGDPHGLIEEAYRALPPGLSRLRLRIMAERAYLLFLKGKIREARELTTEAVTQADELRDDLVQGRVLSVAQMTMFGVMTEDERATMATQLLELAQRKRVDDFEFAARTARVIIAAANGDSAGVADEAAACRQLAQRHRRSLQRWSAAAWEAAVALFEGRTEEAARLQEAALEIGQAAQAPNSPVSFATQRLFLYRELDRLGELYPSMAAIEGGFAEHPAWRAALGFAEIELGQGVEITRLIGALMTSGFSGIPRDALWSGTVAILTEIISDLQLGDAAAGLLARVRAVQHGRFVAVGEASVLCAPWSYYLGRLLATAGELELAAASLTSAEQEAESAGAPIWASYARLYRGALTSATEAPFAIERRSLLESVGERSAVAGYRRLERKASELLAVGVPGEGLPRGAKPGGLTQRELEVLRLIIAQHTNREIAEQLTLSVHTVVRHVDNVLRKTNSANRAEAARWAVANGI